MGVRGLTNLLRRFAPRSIILRHPQDYRKKRVAIDASLHLNKFMFGKEQEDVVHPHIAGFYSLASFCGYYEIEPVFVFDGEQRAYLKKRELERRRLLKSKVVSSLAFEKKRTVRIKSMSEILLKNDHMISSNFRQQVLSILESPESITDHQVHISVQPDKIHNKENISVSELSPDGEYLEESIQVLPVLVQEIQRSKIIAEDKTKYTQTIRDLMTREYSLLKVFAEGEDIKQALEDFATDSHNHIASLENRAIVITPELRKESAAFLKAMGYPVFICENHEAEAMCAQMATLGFVDYVNSDDMDVCAFGDKPLLRHFSLKDKKIMEIDPRKARAELNISKESFIDLCILCGTDFSSTIPNVGPIRALGLIREHTSIENIIKNQQKYQPREHFTYEEAREVFLNPPSVERDRDLYEHRKSDEVFAELMQAYGLSEEEMRMKLDWDKEQRSMAAMEQQNQNGDHAIGPDPFREMETV